MKINIAKKLTLLGWLLGCTQAVQAQRGILWAETNGSWSVQAGLSATRYYGDLSEPFNSHLQLGIALQIAAIRRLTERFSVRAETRLYHLYASQKYTINARNNLSFTTLAPDGWLGIQADLLPIDENQQNILYAWLGGGVTLLAPATRYNNQLIRLAPLHTEGKAYSRWAPIVTYGIGIPFNLSTHDRFNVEVNYTHAFTDYLDDVSTVYVNTPDVPANLLGVVDRSGEVGAPNWPVGSKRGNSEANDGYLMLGIRYTRLLR